MIRFLQTPGRLQKTLLIGFLAIICIMMVVTLVPGGILGDTFGGSANAVAKVGSREVTLQEVQTQARMIARQQFPRGNVPEQVMPFFYQRAAEGLVMQDIFLTEANRLGLTATDEELRNTFQHGPFAQQFFPEGQFIGADAYKNFVQTQFQMSVPQFEEAVKKDLTMTKLRNLIEGSVTVSQADVADLWKRQNTKAKVGYAIFSVEQLAKGVNPSDAELRAFYEKNQQQFANSIPEERKAQYIMIDAAKLAEAKPTADDLQTYYKQHQDEFRVPESVTARHILIATAQPGSSAQPDQKTIDAARAKADDIAKQARSGANFADLAKKYSDDPGSKNSGGELGQVRRGQTVPEFEQAAFGAKKGDIAGPVKTQYGFHIIQVQEKTDAHVKPLEEVRAQIEPIIARQKAQGAAEQLARKVESQARTMGLDKAAAENRLQVTTTGFFTRGDSLPGIGSSPQFMDFAFGQKPMAPPTAVATPQGFVVAQVADVKPARTPSFDEVKTKIAEELRREKAQSMLAQKTQELSDKARSMHDLKAAAAQTGAVYKTSDLVTPDQQIPELGALGSIVDIAAMKPGEISGAVPAGRNGAVIQVLEKQEPAMSEFDKAKDSIREALLQRKRSEVLEVYMSSLRDRMEKAGKVKIYENRLKQLTPATPGE